MTQTFEGAQPQVVKGKQKYKDSYQYGDAGEDEDRDALNIMYDKRVFRGNTHNFNLLKANLTPAQKEEQRIKMEREKKKVEMIKQTLIEYKNNKKQKKSPYELRPLPPARIEVDLTYFLTEQGREAPEEAEVKTQTDNFIQKPQEAQYIPKKTGIDKITQIEDYDLFDYDREVQPILNVLLTKTVEQALLEVEEETELDEIRKFKTEYQKRQENQNNGWEQEVKREMSRIKQKNKALNTARVKREQQIKTMHKLQCLNISKNFLQGCFKGTLQHLAEHSYWRDGFKDQLEVAYKDQLYSKVLVDTEKHTQVRTFVDSVVDKEVVEITGQKKGIRKAMAQKQAKREKTRAIESADTRCVHFIFNPLQPVKISPFARKFVKLMDGTLEEFEKEEHEKFDSFIDKLQDETLEDNEAHPVAFGTNPYEELELNTLKRLSFAVADNPFFKTDVAKYYPECHVISSDGQILATVGPDSPCFKDTFPSLTYCENFRDERMKINDDRKVKFTLGEFKDKGTMILLTVRTNDIRKVAIAKESDYNVSWFRLQNEDTSQTLDYTKINTIELPEDYVEDAENEDDADADDGANKGPRNELVYCAGRIYRDPCQDSQPDIEDKPCPAKWIYEKWNQVTTTQQFPNVAQKLSDLYCSARIEHEDYERRLEEAKKAVVRAAEERRMAQIAALAKKQNKAKNKKTNKKEEAPADEEDEKKNPEEPVEEGEERELDLYVPAQFALALKDKTPRRFMFGPVEFSKLNDSESVNPFDHVESRQDVIDVLENTSVLGEAGGAICVHGYQVLVKERTLKRRSSILKHSRFLANLEVRPKYPSDPEPIVEEKKEEDEEEGSDIED